MKCIGISIIITQETDDMSHHIFRMFGIHSFDDKQYPKEYEVFIENIIKKSIDLIREVK